MAGVPVDADWQGRLDALPTTRTCAGCELCCTLMAVKELAKDPWRPCAHLAAGHGCAIWGAHPGSCKGFTCLWRRSDTLLPPGLFPADCGFMLAVDQIEAWPTVVKVCAETSRPRAWDQPAYRQIFQRLAAAWNCAVVVIEEGMRGVVAFAPGGRVYERGADPEVFPADGRELAVPAADYGPDRRPPADRIAQAAFRWDAP